MDFVLLFCTALLGSLVTILSRNINEWFKEKRRANKIKNILWIELKENISHISEIGKVLEFLDGSKLGTDLEILNMEDKELNEIFLSDNDFINEAEKSFKSVDRHLFLISNIVYKDVYLKSLRIFHNGEDEFFHEIYIYLIKIENYKNYINSQSKEYKSREIYELYNRVLLLVNQINLIYKKNSNVKYLKKK